MLNTEGMVLPNCPIQKGDTKTSKQRERTEAPCCDSASQGSTQGSEILDHIGDRILPKHVLKWSIEGTCLSSVATVALSQGSGDPEIWTTFFCLQKV